jgi:hypothetical protein
LPELAAEGRVVRPGFCAGLAAGELAALAGVDVDVVVVVLVLCW